MALTGIGWLNHRECCRPRSAANASEPANSRNRRAGQLLGQGVPAEQIPEMIGQASEALDSVPLIAETITAAGVDAEGLNGLAALIRGELGAEAWVAGLRRAERSRRAA